MPIAVQSVKKISMVCSKCYILYYYKFSSGSDSRYKDKPKKSDLLIP